MQIIQFSKVLIINIDWYFFAAADQQASASWNNWDVDTDFFSQQDILQTHPTRGGGPISYSPGTTGFKVRHEDFRLLKSQQIPKHLFKCNELQDIAHSRTEKKSKSF